VHVCNNEYIQLANNKLNMITISVEDI
jgi:hypothetical protein